MCRDVRPVGGGLEEPSVELSHQTGIGYPLTKRFRQLMAGGKMELAAERIEINMHELETLHEHARQEPLGEEAYKKLKGAMNTVGYVAQQLDD